MLEANTVFEPIHEGTRIKMRSMVGERQRRKLLNAEQHTDEVFALMTQLSKNLRKSFNMGV